MPRVQRANNDKLLQQIASFCRRAGMAESTFGRRVVNDGKFVARLRFGGRITTQTADRIQSFIAGSAESSDLSSDGQPVADSVGANGQTAAAGIPRVLISNPETSFRFHDNRQKYLLFVHTCSEKWVTAQRIEMELEALTPRSPALRVFESGVGDGTVLSRVMRSMHDKFPTVPFYVVGKEVSSEDLRLALDKMADRFYEHPSTVLVMTNLPYADAPWLRPSTAAASGMMWHELALTGSSCAQFERQIAQLQPLLSAHWRDGNGEPAQAGSERPFVLVIYRDDHKFLLEPIRPVQGETQANFDLVIASHPYQARTSADFKASKVVAPLARALGPGGRLIGIHSHGHDPGMEIIQRVWPGEEPFATTRDQLLRATKQAMGTEAAGYSFNTYSDQRSLFKYDMHTLPSEISASIGTSTLMAAWNAAIYVAQIDDQRLETAMSDSRYLDVTREVLRKHGKLWFLNESYVISRHRHVR